MNRLPHFYALLGKERDGKEEKLGNGQADNASLWKGT